MTKIEFALTGWAVACLMAGTYIQSRTSCLFLSARRRFEGTEHCEQSVSIVDASRKGYSHISVMTKTLIYVK